MRVWLFIKPMHLDECKVPLVTQRGTLFHNSFIYLFFFSFSFNELRTASTSNVDCGARRMYVLVKKAIKVERNMHNKRRKLLNDESSLYIQGVC